jgi:hypothetical protein
MYILLLLTFIQIVHSDSSDTYCESVQNSGSISCHDCVEITLLGGRPNCAYCANPYVGMNYCQKPFYPPSLNIPGLTIYACYNDSGNPSDYFRYKPRCDESDCYIDQCIVSGKILWYYIVPGVIGFVILIIIIWIIGCKWWKIKQSSKYIERENNIEIISKQQLQDISNKRKSERDKVRNIIKQKYLKNDFIEEDIV